MTLSRALRAKLFEFDFAYSRPWRYLLAAFATLRTLLRERPTVILVQNPSIVLGWLATTYGTFMRIPVVVDAHNAGLIPPGPSDGLARRLAGRVLANATLTIVTNANLERHVRQHGGRAFVLPDPIPDFESDALPQPLTGRHTVLFICTYAYDEPYLEVIEAARSLDPDTVLYISGNPRERRERLAAMAPGNVVFTGYLPEADFVAMLHSVDVVVDLTSLEDCLVCGAYEALAAGKPMVLSDNPASRAYFSCGACYTDNSAADVARAIREALANRQALARDVKELRTIRIEEGRQQRAQLNALLRRLSRGDAVTL